MVRPPPDSNRIHPHRLLRLLVPHSLELLLADRTRRVRERRIKRDRDPLFFWIFGFRLGFGGRGRAGRVGGFEVLGPLLVSC